MRKSYFGKGTMSRVALVLAIMLAAAMIMMVNSTYAEGEAGIKLDKKILNLETGETVKLEATITPEGGNLDDVKWSSSPKKVATVEKGEVKALKAGIAEITANYKGAEASCYVYVEKATPPEKLTVEVADGNVNKSKSGVNFFTVGCKEKTFRLKAVPEPAGSSAKVKWTSNKAGFAIDEDGVVTPPEDLKNAEYVTFTASSVHNKNTGKIEVYVLPKMGWGKNPTTVQIPENGIIGTIPPYLQVSPGQYNDYKIVDYSTEQKDIIDLDFEDKSYCGLYPKAPGKVTITAKDRFNDENKVTTELTVKGFYVTDPQGTVNESIVEQGKTLQLTGKGVKADEITWKTDDREVVKVGENTGLVEGVKPGKAVIKAEWDTDKDGNADYTAVYEVHVVKPDKAYPTKFYTSIGMQVYEDEEYKKPLKLTEKYLDKEMKAVKAHFFSIADESEKTYYVNSNTYQMRLGAVFDDKKVKMELKNGDNTVNMESGKEIGTTLEPGENKIVVKASSTDGKGEDSTYTFKIVKGYQTQEGIRSIGVTTVDREPSQTEYNGQTEGALSPRFSSWSPVTDYKVFVFSDITKVKVTATPQDYTTGHIGYSTDGGNTWKENVGNTTTDEVSIPESNSSEVLIRCVSDASYKKSKKENPDADPFANASKTYKVTINRVDANPESLGLANIKKVDLGEGLTWCSPKWAPGYTESAAVVAHNTENAVITYHVKKGAKLYKGSVDDANLLKPSGEDEDGNDLYTVETKTPLKDQGSNEAHTIAVSTGEGEKVATGKFKFKFYKVGTTKGTLKGVHDSVVGYMCPGSQYTSGGNQGWGTFGIFPEKINMGTGNWYSCISLGNFGGFMTLKYDKAITDDPKHPYGIDFTVFGNSNGGEGFSEPGNVLVSEDGKKWYSLAGSDHYDSTTMWDYSVTYKKNPNSKVADYEDNLGNKDTLGVGFAGTSYSMPDKKWYPLYDWKEGEDKAITFTGTRVFGSSVPENKGLENGSARLPAFGYVDTHRNSSTVAGTGEDVNLYEVPVGNPYVSGYDGYGDGFDLKWAVDKDGNPVDSSKLKIHYVKVQTASFIGAGAIGEKSTEISCISRTSEEKEDLGKTADPKITIAGQKLNITEDRDVYNVVLDSDKSYDVDVEAGADANVYINNQRAKTRHYEGLPDKKMLRIITQEGKAAPSIKYIHLTVKGSGDAVEERAQAEEVENLFNALPEEVTRENYSDVVKARARYEELSKNAKTYVTNVEKLVQAEENGKGFNLAEKIDKLSSEDEVKVKDVEALRKAYDALNDKQKKDVYTYNNLLIMEKLIKLQGEVDKIKADKNTAITNPLAKPTDKANPIVKTPAGDKTGNTTENEKANRKKSLKIAGLKIKRVKRAFVLTWKKNGNAVMYEIAYKKKGSKSYKRLKTVKATRVKTGKLKKNKYYYFKVRAVGKVNGSTEYGGWTTAKKVKCR